jgi:Type III restriction enzyme, res subunit/Helicase conserved C-terminal domain
MRAAPTYVLPNRKAFSDSITRMFIKSDYRAKDKDPLDEEDKNIDLCTQRTGTGRELFPYQKIIRDYLKIETPYRGILVYHGLGSGKTCSSIAVAESLLTTSKVFVMVPASLEKNYKEELQKCGDPIYAVENFWTVKPMSDEVRAEGKKLGISDKFMDRNNRIYTTTSGNEPNFESLSTQDKKAIREQISDLLEQRFTFVRYNGLTRTNIPEYTKEGMYDDSVVIIDEAHNLISRVINESEITGKLYDAIYNAKRCKVVALSGTPVINSPNEIAYMMNLLRGPIERITIPFKTIPTWDEERITKAFRAIPEVDTIEFSALKKHVMVTRNPPQFRSTYNGDGDRVAVQYMKDLPFVPQAADWVGSIKSKVEIEVGGGEISSERVTTEQLTCLPTDYEEFSNLFLDGLNIKNPMMFRRRIQGLVSYFKGADERLLPRRIDLEHTLEKVEMSTEQFTRYLEVRWIEMKIDSRRGRSKLNENLSTFRVPTRLVCDYATPPDLRVAEVNAEGISEDKAPDNNEVLKRIKGNPNKYLSEKALEAFSPKMLAILKNIKKSLGSNQFVYSQYRALEGLGILSAILDTAGWQRYKLVKQANQWVEDPDMLDDRPAYTFYTGEENEEERDLTRQIFNGVYSKNFPASLKESIAKRPKKILQLLMASASGAEGITLANVRHVHIVEPHWTPARHDQVIGRAIRICSHATLPMEDRTVKVSFYISVFSDSQKKTQEGPNITPIRRNDMVMKRYEGDPVETFMSTDEYLYETAFEKERISQRIALLLKESAIDCEIHRKLHSKEKPVVSCMRFDSTTTGEDLAFRPNIKNEELDETVLRNTSRKHRRLQRVLVKGMSLILDPDSKEIFDGPAWDDNQRLLRMGELVSPTSIRFLL